jgi:hypothetical protein
MGYVNQNVSVFLGSSDTNDKFHHRTDSVHLIRSYIVITRSLLKMNVYLENVALGGVILVTLEEGFADREPLEEDSAGDYCGAGREPLEEDSAGDDGGAGREPLDNGGHCLYKAGADGEALVKVGASIDKKAGIELRFLASHLTSLAGTCREGDLSHDITLSFC